MELNPKLEKYIATRDKKINAKSYCPIGNPLQEAFTQLLDKGEITLGGRSTCGTYLDPTWTRFTLWNEVVKKAQSLGYEISVEPIKQKNAYATVAGGFWHENKYSLIGNKAA
jgi:hypothetical protein